MELDETKILIAKTAKTLFTQFGVRSVTMDDVCREMGISKKTLYKYFTEKNELIESVIHSKTCELENEIQQIMDAIQNPLEQIVQIAKAVMRQNANMNPSLLFDLKKYHRPQFDFFTCSVRDSSLKQIKANLELGIATGLYRKNINIDIISNLYHHIILTVFNPVEYPLGNSIEESYTEVVKYHMHACVSEKGLKELEKLEKENLI